MVCKFNTIIKYKTRNIKIFETYFQMNEPVKLQVWFTKLRI